MEKNEKPQHEPDKVRRFYAWCDSLDRFVLRPLSHIAPNWEATWSHGLQQYVPEHDSFAQDLNEIIERIAICPRPSAYHSHEDAIIETSIRKSGWPVQKKGNRWITTDYRSLLQSGSFYDLEQLNLIAAAAGRTQAAMDFDQMSYDNMEEGHQYILSAILSLIIYQRYSDGCSLLTSES